MFIFPKKHYLYFIIISYIALLSLIIYSIYSGNFNIKQLPAFLLATLFIIIIVRYLQKPWKNKKLLI